MQLHAVAHMRHVAGHVPAAKPQVLFQEQSKAARRKLASQGSGWDNVVISTHRCSAASHSLNVTVSDVKGVLRSGSEGSTGLTVVAAICERLSSGLVRGPEPQARSPFICRG